MKRPTFETHIKALQIVSLEEASGEVVLAAPSLFTREWVEKRYLRFLEEALSEVLDQPISLRVIVAGKQGNK